MIHRLEFRIALAGIVAFGCSSGGLQGKPCEPGCVDEKTRLECPNGSPQAVSCEQPAEACAESVCKAGACEVRPAVDAPCGKDGNAKCNEAYVCLGPDLQLTAIRQHTCALADDGKVYCWGGGPFGELGDGTKEDRGSPVLVRGLPGPATKIAAGYAHTCALLGEGEVYCWGNNSAHQTSPDTTDDPITEPRLVPSPVAFTDIFMGQGHSCGLTAEGTVYCWGNTAAGQCGADPANGYFVMPTQIPGLDHVKTVSTVKNHLCAVRTEDPTLVCWGSNQYLEKGGYIDYKLGPSTADTKFSTTAVAVDLGKKVIGAGLSYESTYAVTEDGMVYAWGFNEDGYQLGTGSTEQFLDTPTPVMVDVGTPLTNVVELTRSDGSDMCAKIREGSGPAHYVCWGGNDLGELGSGVRGYQIFQYADTPTLLPESSSSLVRGEDHGCAVVATDGRSDVWCWGKRQYTGNGSLDPDLVQPDPTPVKWDPAVTAPPLE